MSFSTLIDSGLGRMSAAKNSFMGLPTSRKIAAGYAVLHVAFMKKAYDRAQKMTQGKGLTRSLIVGAKTAAGPLYWLGSLGYEMINVKAASPRVSIRKASAKKFNLTALNNELATIRGGKSLKSLDRQYTQGMSVLKKHNAPAKLIKAFKAGFAIAVKAAKQEAKATLSSTLVVSKKHSANKFEKKESAKNVTAPVAPAATVPAK